MTDKRLLAQARSVERVAVRIELAAEVIAVVLFILMVAVWISLASGA
jgi:hypothetical protein